MLLFYFWTEEQKNRSHNCYGICISHISLPRTFKFVCKGSITNKRQSCAFDTKVHARDVNCKFFQPDFYISGQKSSFMNQQCL